MWGMARRSVLAKPVETKVCVVCGRPFSNRRRWARRGVWDEVRYCSQACRQRRGAMRDQRN